MEEREREAMRCFSDEGDALDARTDKQGENDGIGLLEDEGERILAIETFKGGAEVKAVQMGRGGSF